MRALAACAALVACLSTGCLIPPGCMATDLVAARQRIEALPFAQREAEYDKVREMCDRPHWAERPSARRRSPDGLRVTCTTWKIGNQTTVSCN